MLDRFGHRRSDCRGGAAAGAAEGTPRKALALVVLLALALAAGAAVFAATRRGVGVTPDSSVYLSVAENLRRDQGVTVPFRYYPLGDAGIGTPPPGRVEPLPSRLTHYQPLLPWVLSAVGPRTVNAVSTALTVFVVGVAVYSFTASLAAGMTASVLVGASAEVLSLSARVLSEPLFIMLTMVALSWLARHLERPKMALLIASSSAMALALLDRYAGAAAVVTGIILLRKRPRQALVLAAVGGLPAVAWLLYNGGSTNRALGFHLRPGTPKQVLSTASSWVLPADLPAPLQWALGLTLLAALSLFFARTRLSGLPLVTLVFAAVYAVVVMLTALFLDASTIFDSRLLSPVFVSLVVAVACVMRARAVLVAMAVMTFAGGSLWLAREHPDVLEYAGPWQESPVLSAARRLPANQVIYSNAPDALWAVNGRSVSTVPEKVNFVTDRANARFARQMDEMVDTLESRQGVVVYVRRSGREFAASEEDLQHRGLRLVVAERDGAIYEPRAPDG